MSYLGETATALDLVDQALSLEKRPTMLFIANHVKCEILIRGGRFEGAIGQYESTLKECEALYGTNFPYFRCLHILPTQAHEGHDSPRSL